MAFLDRTIFTATTGGTADFTVSSAVTGYMTPAQAGAEDGASYGYAAQTLDGSGNITAWEVGRGAYTAGSTELARTSILFSSNSNAKVNFASAPSVIVCPLADDFPLPFVIGSQPISGGTPGYVLTVGAENELEDVPFMTPPYVFTPLGYQQLALTGTAAPLTVPGGAIIAQFSLENAAARYRDDGTPPTAAVGMPVLPSEAFQYSGNLTAIQFIAQSGSPVLNVSYYK